MAVRGYFPPARRRAFASRGKIAAHTAILRCRSGPLLEGISGFWSGPPAVLEIAMEGRDRRGHRT